MRNLGALKFFRSLPRVPPPMPPCGPEFTAPDDAPLKTQQVIGWVNGLYDAAGGRLARGGWGGGGDDMEGYERGQESAVWCSIESRAVVELAVCRLGFE